MNMLEEYAKITESAEHKKTTVDESSLTDEFIEKLAKKVANVLMKSANDENENENENDNDKDNDNGNDNNENEKKKKNE